MNKCINPTETYYTASWQKTLAIIANELVIKVQNVQQNALIAYAELAQCIIPQNGEFVLNWWLRAFIVQLLLLGSLIALSC